MTVTLRPSVAEDIDWLVELRAEVLRADLERLGRYDEQRVRDRMRAAFRPEWTRIIVNGSDDLGSISTRPGRLGSVDRALLPHRYATRSRPRKARCYAPCSRNRGPGRHDWNVLQGSPARRLYERNGFVADTEDDVDIFMTLVGSR